MGAWVVKLEAMLAADAERPCKEQRTAQRLHDGLVQEGFRGSYRIVQRFVKAWREERRHGVGSVFIPQSFAPGEAYQFDWSYEMVDLGGRPTPVKEVGYSDRSPLIGKAMDTGAARNLRESHGMLRNKSKEVATVQS
jgi:hypothetical protein